MNDVIIHESHMVKLIFNNYSYQKSIIEDHLICKGLIEAMQKENMIIVIDANE